MYGQAKTKKKIQEENFGHRSIIFIKEIRFDYFPLSDLGRVPRCQKRDMLLF
jgi:hypothetical protein